MKKEFFASVLLGSAVFSASAFAACTTTYCSNVQVNGVKAQPTGDFEVRIRSDKTSLNCTLLPGNYMLLPATDNGRLIFEQMSTNLETGRRIFRVGIVDGSSPCEVAFVQWQR